MLQLIFMAVFMVAMSLAIYLIIPKNTDLPGEAIFGEQARTIVKESLMKPIDWLAYQINNKDKKCLEVLGESSTKFAMRRAFSIIFFVVLMYLTLGPLAAVVGAAIGWFAPSPFLRKRYSAWQDGVVADIPTMVDYLIVYFSVGYNVKQALVETTQVVGPSLSSELKRVLADIEITKDYRGALDRFSNRVNNYHVDMVLQRLKSAWETKADVDLFQDLADSIVEMRKLKVSMETAKYKIFMVILPVLGVMGFFVIVGVPLVYWLMGQFTDFSTVSNN